MFVVHHIGVVVADIEKAAQEYVDRFGYERQTDVIHDPTQTAFVLFLRLPGDSVLVELVAPDRAESKLTQALRRGGGLNHICYASRDLEAACQALRARGCFQVQPPTPAVAFGGRQIAWFVTPDGSRVELVDAAAGEVPARISA